MKKLIFIPIIMALLFTFSCTKESLVEQSVKDAPSAETSTDIEEPGLALLLPKAIEGKSVIKIDEYVASLSEEDKKVLLENYDISFFLAQNQLLPEVNKAREDLFTDMNLSDYMDNDLLSELKEYQSSEVAQFRSPCGAYVTVGTCIFRKKCYFHDLPFYFYWNPCAGYGYIVWL